MPAVAQRNFAFGEISPSMQGRADMVPYAAGLRLAHGVLVRPQGGLMNCPGTEYVRTNKVVGAKLFAFIFDSDFQSYCLEMGYDDDHPTASGAAGASGYIRFSNLGSPLVLPAGASAAAPAWANATAYEIGDLVSHGTRHYYCTADHTSSTGTLEPGVVTGDAYWYRLDVDPDVTNGSIFEIPIPYGSNEDSLSAPFGIDDIWSAHANQSGDTIVFCNRRKATAEIEKSSYVPYLLKRFEHLRWTFQPARFIPDSVSPTGLAITSSAAASLYPLAYVHRYKVTSHKKGTGEESIVGHLAAAVAGTITAAGAADVRVNDAAHGLTEGQEVFVNVVTSTGVLDPVLNAAILEQAFPIHVVDVDNFELKDTAGIPLPAATHSLTYSLTVVSVTAAYPSEMHAANFNTVGWTAVTDAEAYSVYKETGDGSGNYGFLDRTLLPTVKDIGTPPLASESPPSYPQKFLLDEHHPGMSAFFAQRLGFGNSEAAPQTITFSRTGNFFSFSKREPIQDDDRIIAAIPPRRSGEILHLPEWGEGGLLLRSNGEGVLTGNADGLVAPSTIRHRPQGFRGASRVEPAEIADRIIYAQSRGNELLEIVRGDFAGYAPGIDPALFNQHLFGAACGCSVVRIAWAEKPDKVLWVIRTDGVALGMTYLPDQNVRGWTWRTTEGLVQHFYRDVVVIPEGSLDSPYFIVQREIDGETVEYAERMSPRCGGCEDA